MIRDSIACPECAHEPAMSKCWRCGWELGAEASTTDTTPANRGDARSEDERKRDARPAVEALGWTVVDLEQGFRPFTCRHCGGPIAGGTRVPKGTPDWIVMGHGLAVWIEWKSGTGRATPEQRAFADTCDAAGVPHATCRTTAEAVAFLQGVRL